MSDRSEVKRRRLRFGMVGGGVGSFISPVHRIAARIDDKYQLVSATLPLYPERARTSGRETGLENDRIYSDFEEMAAAEACRADGIEVHYEIMWEGSDVDFAVQMIVTTKVLFPDFCAASFDRGFQSQANRARLDELLVDNVLPKKGRLSKADRDREQGETFAAMRRQHPAVESAINNLEHRGLDCVRSKGREGFARTVALSVVALNVGRLGRLLRQQARDRLAA